jgi:hypothetical protein
MVQRSLLMQKVLAPRPRPFDPWRDFDFSGVECIPTVKRRELNLHHGLVFAVHDETAASS